VCNKFCDSKEDVEEVVQDTFLIAFKKAGTLKCETFMAYLRKIAIHESLRKRNANLRLQNYVVSMDEEQTKNHPELNTDFLPEQNLQNKEYRIELLQIIKSLPKRQWQMVYMYYYANLSTSEIAELMDCTVHSTHQTLSTARKTIKPKLGATPLAALLFMEEQIFAAGYIPTAAPSIANAGAENAANSTGFIQSPLPGLKKGYVIAASITAVCAVCVALYFALRPAQEYYHSGLDVSMPYTSAPDPEPPAVYEPEWVTDPEEKEEPQQEEPEPEIYEPEPEAELEPQQEEPPPTAEPTPPEETEPPYEPIHTDRTPEILAALATANNAQDVNSIIGYYNFAFAYQTRRHTTGEQLRFYTTNEGSGDILIGIATYENGDGWRMNFELYADGNIPDVLGLLNFVQD